MSDDDLDDLLAQPPRPGPTDCHICWAIARSPEATAVKLAEAAARTDISPKKLGDAIHARFPQINPSPTSVQNHRRAHV